MFSFVSLQSTDPDNPDEVILTDMISYALVSYAPGVATLRPSAFGDGAYSDVVDTLTFHAMGDTAAEAYQAADAVLRLLEQAERWWRGEVQYSVVLRLIVQDSIIGKTVVLDAQPLEAAVKGYPAQGQQPITLEVIHVQNDTGSRYVAQNLGIAFVRRGPLLLIGTAGTSFNDGVDLNLPTNALLSASGIATLDMPGPFDLTISGLNEASAITLSDSVLAIVDDRFPGTATSMALQGCSGGTAAGFTSVADAANNAVGNVLRYTPTSTAAAQSGDISPSISDSYHQRFQLYATIRNNSATLDFLVSVQVYSSGGATGLLVASTPVVAIAAGSVQPRVVYLGSVAMPPDPTLSNNPALPLAFFRFTVQAPVITGPPTLDINQLLLIGDDDETTTIIGIPANTVPASATSFRIQQQLLDLPGAAVYKTPGGIRDPLSYSGDVRCVSQASALKLVWLCPRAQYWRLTDPSGTFVADLNISIIRSVAYRVPQ